jgi:hypothetical protein
MDTAGFMRACVCVHTCMHVILKMKVLFKGFCPLMGILIKGKGN